MASFILFASHFLYLLIFLTSYNPVTLGTIFHLSFTQVFRNCFKLSRVDKLKFQLEMVPISMQWIKWLIKINSIFNTELQINNNQLELLDWVGSIRYLPYELTWWFIIAQRNVLKWNTFIIKWSTITSCFDN